jgi:hypothetical protein
MTEYSDKLKVRREEQEKRARKIDAYQYEHRKSWQTPKVIFYAKIWMWFLRVCCVGTMVLAFMGLFWKTVWLYLILPILVDL